MPSSPPSSPHIIIDIRESWQYCDILGQMGATTSVKTLPAGDFILSGKIAAERKTRADFEASIIDGRLFEQASRLCAAYERTVLIVEGTDGAGRVSKQAMLGAYSSLISNNNISIFFTKTPAATCELLFAMAKYEQISPKNMPRICAKQKALTLPQYQRLLIESLPSAGPKLAKNLLIHFGSPRNIFSAGQKELEDVPLLGKKRAKLIKNVLDSVYPYEKEP